MRLWHQELILYLPTQWLLGQHRECCAMRGKMWGRKHSTVDYVWEHPFEWLVAYHWRIMDELELRGCSVAPKWFTPDYRGKNCSRQACISTNTIIEYATKDNRIIYPEHDDNYLQECLSNLRLKGVDI